MYITLKENLSFQQVHVEIYFLDQFIRQYQYFVIITRRGKVVTMFDIQLVVMEV